MRILAIESSGLVASTAVVEEDCVLGEYTLNYKKTHSQTLLPMINQLKEMLDLDLNSLDAIAVSKGPGSFTGLRIGSATAKGLGLALNLPIVPVPTLEAMACQLFGVSGLICPVMDARRAQVYTGIYRFSEGTLQTVEDQQALFVAELAEKLNGFGEQVIFLGDGVPVYKKILEDTVKVPYCFAPAYASRQRAAAVGICAVARLKDGKTETADAHKPVYLRIPQAERERLKREQANENP